MACACKGRSNTEYVWTSDDGKSTVVYASEVQAKAKKMRHGGSFVSRPKG